MNGNNPYETGLYWFCMYLNAVYACMYLNAFTLNAEIVSWEKCRGSCANFFMGAKIYSQEKFCFYRYAQRKKVNSLQELVKIKSWLLLIFSIYLHNQLKFHNSRTPGIRRTPGSRGTSGPLGNLVPAWYPSTPGIPWTSMVLVKIRTIGCSKFIAIRVPL